MRGFLAFFEAFARGFGDVMTELFTGFRCEQQRQYRTDPAAHE
jgi:hypothetical protein